jgi:hypothetical protein
MNKAIPSLLLLCLISLAGNTQTNNFRLDTLVDSYQVRIKVYEQDTDKENIKAYFSFYDSSKEGKLQFVYYFKYLPPTRTHRSKSFVPIFQDWVNKDNSRYLWKDITYNDFNYDSIKNYVFDQLKHKHAHHPETPTLDTLRLQSAAKNAFLNAFNALIHKDYLTFVETIHPAQLKKATYQLKADDMHRLYQSSGSFFTKTSVEKIGGLVNFFGEIQVLLHCTNTLEVNGEKNDLVQYIVACSFDNGANWYFKEVSRLNYAQYADMSKGSISETAISWELIKKLNL